jgi:thymidylate synthase
MPKHQTLNISADHINRLFRDAAKTLLKDGKEVKVKENLTLELHPFTLILEDPTKRTLVYPGRGNNPFSTLFETLWVLSGNNNIKDLKFFLPRAADFSDNGVDWRAGYGTRIFRHLGINSERANGIVEPKKGSEWEYIKNRPVDQFEYVYNTLRSDPTSRQAVITIWDPAKECTVEKSKDYPCSNYLTFLIRDGKLDLTLNMRSNDILWGFSSINVYEFTVLQEIMANMLGVEVGTYYHTANSFHCYKTGFNAEKNFANLQRCAELEENELPEWLRELPAQEFTGICQNYELTILYWRTLYIRVCHLMNAGPHLFERLINEFYEKDDGSNPLYTYMYLYILFQKEETVKSYGFVFQKLYRHHMSKIPMTDIKLSCHFWMLKQWKMIKPTELERAYKLCTQLKERK